MILTRLTALTSSESYPRKSFSPEFFEEGYLIHYVNRVNRVKISIGNNGPLRTSKGVS
jgi:hypothetical protein